MVTVRRAARSFRMIALAQGVVVLARREIDVLHGVPLVVDRAFARPPVMEMEADLGKSCGCVRDRYLRCALVVDVAVRQEGRAPARELPLETWDYDGEECYWAYTGPDTGGRCPGQR